MKDRASSTAGPEKVITSNIHFSGSDINKLLQPSFPVETPGQGASPLGSEGSPSLRGSGAEPPSSCQHETDFSIAAILDIPTPESGQIISLTVRSPTPQSGQIKRTLSRVSRRLFNRTILGVKLPGRYYFITWTSSPQSPPIEKSWRALRKQIKRWRPGSSHCYCITDEGHGVIHMVIRMGPGEKRLDVKEVRSHWQRLHKATQIRIDHIPESGKNNLAAYIADQRAKRKLGGEMAWQDELVRWRWSKGWLPKGFTKEFGRLWWSLQNISPELREKVVNDWLRACHENPDKISVPPRVGPGNEIIYQKMPVQSVSPGALDNRVAEWLTTYPKVQYDKTLDKAIRGFVVGVSPPEPDCSVREDQVTITKWTIRETAESITEQVHQSLNEEPEPPCTHTDGVKHSDAFIELCMSLKDRSFVKRAGVDMIATTEET